jgi:hypothetical protein
LALTRVSEVGETLVGERRLPNTVVIEIGCGEAAEHRAKLFLNCVRETGKEHASQQRLSKGLVVNGAIRHKVRTRRGCEEMIKRTDVVLNGRAVLFHKQKQKNFANVCRNITRIDTTLQSAPSGNTAAVHVLAPVNVSKNISIGDLPTKQMPKVLGRAMLQTGKVGKHKNTICIDMTIIWIATQLVVVIGPHTGVTTGNDDMAPCGHHSLLIGMCSPGRVRCMLRTSIRIKALLDARIGIDGGTLG